MTHFRWYQFHPIHVFILKPFDTAECQNRTSQAGYCIVSAELESKSKNCWDFKIPPKEEWRQPHPTWICCSQQEKPEKGTEDTPARDTTWGSPTPPQQEGPSRTCMGASSSSVVTPGFRISLTNTQGRWLLLFHKPQGLQDSLQDPQDFRAEINSTDFMSS